MTLYLVFPLRQAEARRNIARAFPELSTSRRRAILRGTYRHFCQALIDFIRMPGYPVERLPQLVHLDEDRIRSVRESGQGLVLVTGHLGNWEVANLILGRLGYPLSGVVVVQRGSGGRFINEVRDDTGSEFITRKTSTRTMLRLLKAGRTVCLCDQVEDPKDAKGIVKRAVVRTITPGTVMLARLAIRGGLIAACGNAFFG